METYLLAPDREPTKEQSTKVHLGEPMKFSWDYFCRSRNQKATPLVGVAADEGWEAGVHCTACGQLSKSSVPGCLF